MRKILTILCIVSLMITSCAAEKTADVQSVATSSITDYDSLNGAGQGWGFVRRKGAPPDIPNSQTELLKKYNGAYLSEKKEKNLYLTFDEGYENGFTAVILDVLAKTKTPAAFFVTGPYLEGQEELIKRMIDEGHIVGNHSSTHPSFPTISREKMAKEIWTLEDYIRKNFNYESKYFRFPAGVYSENALDLVDSVGYKSVFWSIAHTDWDPENQPGVDKSFQTVTERLHPGAVILLHTTSPDNAEILGDFIDYAREQGYEFRTLDQYKYWN